jgi:hypothetical protein
LVEQSAQFERVELSQMVEQLDNLEQALKRSTQPSMTLEIALLSLCHRHDITSIRELEQKIAKLQEAMASGEMPRAASRPPGGPGASAAPPARPSYGGQPSPAAAPQSYSAPRQEAPPRSEPAPRPEAPVSATPPAPPARVEPAASAAPAGGFALIQGDDDEDEEAAAPVVVSSVQTMDQAPAPAGGVMYDRSFEEEEEEGEGFASRPVAQAAASPAPVQRPAAQAPAPPQRQSAPPAPSDYVEGEGQGELSQSGLDEMWGELLEAIHKRSIPAFSLVSTHAFPIRFESKTLTIGVPKEFFQKSIENKTNKIMEAYRDVWNDEVRIIVKVIAEGAPPGGGAAHNAAPRGGDAPMQAAPPRNDVALRASQEPAAARLPQEPNNAYNRTPSNTATATRPEPSSGRSEQRDLDEEADRGRSQSAAPVVSQSKADTSAALDALGDGLDSGKIKEAYRIFEGPGSRLIS